MKRPHDILKITSEITYWAKKNMTKETSPSHVNKKKIDPNL